MMWDNLRQFHRTLQPWFTLVARLVLGGVIFAAGALKANKPSVSIRAVNAYQLLPVNLAKALGYLLPWLEIAVGILIIVGISLRVTSLLAAGLMVIFIFAIAQAGLRGLSIDCGCFGGGGTVAAGKTKYLLEILRDSGLTLLGLYIWRFPMGRLSVEKYHNEGSDVHK